MPQGLEVYDASGFLVLGIYDSLAKIVGYFNTQANVAGSLTLPSNLGGTRVFIMKNATPPVGPRQGTAGRTQVTVSGLTISWTAGRDAMQVYYGVF